MDYFAFLASFREQTVTETPLHRPSGSHCALTVMERRMTSSKLSVRRPTESSKALSASKDKLLSAATLSKRTTSLVFDVEELKNNLKDLQVTGREVVQQEQTLQDLSAKVAGLEHAFNSLSDVCIYVEETQKKMSDGFQDMLQRVVAMEKVVVVLQAQAPKAEAKRKQLQDHTDRRFSDFQEACSKLALSMYETQAELSRVKNSTEHLMTREREASQLTQQLQSTQDQTSEWLGKLKSEAALMQTELYTLKEHSSTANVALASDVQALAKECSGVRCTVTQQHAQWTNKLDTLRETVDRQTKMDKLQVTQRMDALHESLTTYEMRSKDTTATLLKNHARIRDAVDESMSICSSEIKILSQEWKSTHDDHRVKLHDLTQQLAQQSLEASQKHEELRCSVRSMAIQLDLTL